MWDSPLHLGSRSFRSRLIVGSDGFPSLDAMRRCHEASGTELVAVPVRRIDLSRPGESVLDHIDASRTALLPTTADCRTADEAVRTAYLAREAHLGDLIAVEVSGDDRTQFPDVAGIFGAAKTLAREGFTVLAAAGDDPVVARRLEDAGAAAILVLGAPSGSGLGVRNACRVRTVIEAVSAPVILAGGIGTASDAAIAMELGCQGVAVNTAIARASDPEGMAEAMKLAVEAGRFSSKAGRIPRRPLGTAAGHREGVPDWAPW
jgi:thiazole synthase